MAERIWAGRCEDCYDKKPLETYCGPLLPPGTTEAELCAECLEVRHRGQLPGTEPPPLGLQPEPDGTAWTDAPTFTAMVGGEQMTVEVKFLIGDSAAAGLVRLRFNGQGNWLAGGAFSPNAQYALSSARHFLQQHYFPSQRVEFISPS